MIFVDWTPAAKPPPLLEGEIHVWRARLDDDRLNLASLQSWLSAEETDRAARFQFEHLRRRYAAARGLLRCLLGAYLGVPPGALPFDYSPHGKPQLRPGAAGRAPAFNLSHSDDLALFAFAHAARLGVDVERERADFGGEGVAERFFSPTEVAALHALPASAQQHAFFETWARKEAYIKATGEGLSAALDQFDVSVGPSQPPSLLSIRGSPAAAARWSLIDLQPAPGYAAALAIEGRGWRAVGLDLARATAG